MKVTVDGVETFVHAPGGIGPGRPVLVFLHGAGMDHTVWRYQTRRAAAAGWTAIAPDFPGHGRSRGEPLDTIEAMAAWVEALHDALGLGRSVIVGHSMGSLVALSVAASRSDVAGVGLIATADKMSVHPELLAAADRADHLAVDLIVGWSVAGDRRLGGHPNAGTWSRGAVTRLFEKNLDRNLAVDLRACDRHDPVPVTGRVEVPVLIVSGAEDRMTRASAARRLAAHLSDVDVLEIPGGSHLVVCEDPRSVTDRLLEWAATRAVDRPTSV